MITLVLNCGSSSLKYQVLDMHRDDTHELLAKGLVERIGGDEGSITHKPTGKDKVVIEKPIADHAAGIREVLNLLVSKETGVLNSLNDICAVGHRVAHGGVYFKGSALVTEEVIRDIEKCCDLAPLHNPANLLGIKAMEKILPGIPQVAVFDTSFHQTMPDYAYMYAIPYEDYKSLRIRRYGFHGTSHKFVAEKACRLTGMDLNNSKIITCHLGNGSSITAVKNGESIDTSMGFTPVEGIIMGTRCGNIDAGAVTYLQEKKNMNAGEVGTYLNKKCGLQGVSGVSSDFRDIRDAAASGNARAALAKNMLIYDIKKYIGSYIAAMNGVDMIVFTGGIGENAAPVREGVCRDMEYLGIQFDEKANEEAFGTDMVISTPESKVRVIVVTTNEELVIARDTINLVHSN